MQYVYLYSGIGRDGKPFKQYEYRDFELTGDEAYERGWTLVGYRIGSRLVSTKQVRIFERSRLARDPEHQINHIAGQIARLARMKGYDI